ncbi:MAG TPA: FkbM family methyltransferase [Chitinophagaceae bacterium]|jgi:FkbM family methyltransferase
MNVVIANALSRAGLISKLRTSVPIHVNGNRISIPVINGMGYDNLQVWELWMNELLGKILPLKQGAFIDVGVNVGQTLIKLRSIDREREYIGFEPNPHCVYYADALIKENRFANTRLLPVGLLDRDTVLELNLYSEGNTDSAASVIADFRTDKVYRKIYVPVYRFEQLSRQLNLPPAGIVKIDVEGAELEVLQSLQEVLRQQRPIVVIEILPCYNDKNTSRISRQQQLEALVKDAGYRIIRIIKNSDGKSIKQLTGLDSIGIHGNMEWCEYLLLPPDVLPGTSYESLIG